MPPPPNRITRRVRYKADRPDGGIESEFGYGGGEAYWEVTKPIDPTEGLKECPRRPGWPNCRGVTKPIDPTEGLKGVGWNTPGTGATVTKPIDPTEGLKDLRPDPYPQARQVTKPIDPTEGLKARPW